MPHKANKSRARKDDGVPVEKKKQAIYECPWCYCLLPDPDALHRCPELGELDALICSPRMVDFAKSLRRLKAKGY